MRLVHLFIILFQIGLRLLVYTTYLAIKYRVGLYTGNSGKRRHTKALVILNNNKYSDRIENIFIFELKVPNKFYKIEEIKFQELKMIFQRNIFLKITRW